MEKVDVAIAVAGVVVLATAIAGSALYGGSASDAVTLEFQEESHDLEPKTASGSSGNEMTFTFDVTSFNVTKLVFEAAASTAAGSAGAPSLTVTVTSPGGDSFGGDGASVTIPWGKMPATYRGPADGAPTPDASAQGEWVVTVTASGATPAPVPYTVEVSGAVTDYHGHAVE